MSCREHFISNCKLFQNHVETVSEERKKMLLEKDNILKKILHLTANVDSMEASHTPALRGKRTYNEKLIYENIGIFFWQVVSDSHGISQLSVHLVIKYSGKCSDFFCNKSRNKKRQFEIERKKFVICCPRSFL